MTCTPDSAPPVRFQQIQSSTVPKRERRTGLDPAVLEHPRPLGSREVRVEHEPGPLAYEREEPASASSTHRGAVRRSCQTMARWHGRPVERSHATAVSRWLAMPMVAGTRDVAASVALQLRQGCLDKGPDLGGVVFDKPGSGEMLGSSRWDIGHDLALPRRLQVLAPLRFRHRSAITTATAAR